MLNRRVRAIYAGTLSVLGLAVGVAGTSLFSGSGDRLASVAPVSLGAEDSASPAGRTIEGESADWWHARGRGAAAHDRPAEARCPERAGVEPNSNDIVRKGRS